MATSISVINVLSNPSRLLRVVYGPPEESDDRQAQVTTLVNNLRNTGGDVEIGPCGKTVFAIIKKPEKKNVMWCQ